MVDWTEQRLKSLSQADRLLRFRLKISHCIHLARILRKRFNWSNVQCILVWAAFFNLGCNQDEMAPSALDFFEMKKPKGLLISGQHFWMELLTMAKVQLFTLSCVAACNKVGKSVAKTDRAKKKKLKEIKTLKYCTETQVGHQEKNDFRTSYCWLLIGFSRKSWIVWQANKKTPAFYWLKNHDKMYMWMTNFNKESKMCWFFLILQFMTIWSFSLLQIGNISPFKCARQNICPFAFQILTPAYKHLKEFLQDGCLKPITINVIFSVLCACWSWILSS